MKRSVCICMVLLCCLFSNGFFAYAQGSEESIELVTYYPAPYGDYDVIYANFMDFNTSDYNEAGNATPPPEEGRIWYDSDEKIFKFSDDGVSWKTMGSGGGIEVRYASDGDPESPESGDMWIIVPDPR